MAAAIPRLSNTQTHRCEDDRGLANLEPVLQLRQRRGRDSNPRWTKPPIPVFETGAFNRSATSPVGRQNTLVQRLRSVGLGRRGRGSASLGEERPQQVSALLGQQARLDLGPVVEALARRARRARCPLPRPSGRRSRTPRAGPGPARSPRRTWRTARASRTEPSRAPASCPAPARLRAGRSSRRGRWGPRGPRARCDRAPITSPSCTITAPTGMSSCSSGARGLAQGQAHVVLIAGKEMRAHARSSQKMSVPFKRGQLPGSR